MDNHIFFVHLNLIDVYTAETSFGAKAFLHDVGMVEQVPLPLVFVQVGVVVGVAHVVFSRVLEVIGTVGPGISDQRSLAGKVVHAAHGGFSAAPGPGRMVAPVIVERVYERAVHIVQFIGLKVIRRGQPHRVSIEGTEVRVQFGNPALPVAESHPRIAVVIHDGTRIEDGATVFNGFVASIDETLVQR